MDLAGTTPAFYLRKSKFTEWSYRNTFLNSFSKKEKENMTVSGQRIHLITGEDDLVVGRGGMQAFVKVLEENFNIVTSEEPKKLPHHEPGSAAPHLYAFLKNHFGWK